MGMKELVSKFREMRANRVNIRDGLRDDETSNQFLRSLRRQRRVQMEELEMAKLKSQIANFNKKKTSDELFGFKGPNKGIPLLKAKKRPKQVQFGRFKM